mmetsp:Transcript_29646/g.78506  ORF Transcript_29646/g.78506 Transcript_29646/m.78506 type:complete len:185 (-) Transcript_29646:277-831(-)
MPSVEARHMSKPSVEAMPTSPKKKMRELAPEMIQNIKDCFDLFDQDGSGSISFEELTTALTTLGVDCSEKNVHQFIARGDDDQFEMADDSHYQVEFDEFLGMMKVMLQTQTPEDEMKKAFKLFDADKSGKISMASLKKIITESGEAVTDEELQDVIEVCSNGKQEIELADFLRVMRSQGLVPGP